MLSSSIKLFRSCVHEGITKCKLVFLCQCSAVYVLVKMHSANLSMSTWANLSFLFSSYNLQWRFKNKKDFSKSVYRYLALVKTVSLYLFNIRTENRLALFFNINYKISNFAISRSEWGINLTVSFCNNIMRPTWGNSPNDTELYVKPHLLVLFVWQEMQENDSISFLYKRKTQEALQEFECDWEIIFSLGLEQYVFIFAAGSASSTDDWICLSASNTFAGGEKSVFKN